MTAGAPDPSPEGGPPEVRVGDAAEVAAMLAADLEAHARRSRAEGRPLTLAIPGGSVAHRCFPRLAALALGRDAIEFFWTDERAVPADDPESNYAAARTGWLAAAEVPAARIHRMPGESADLETAARSYADTLRMLAGDPPRLDYALLGVGADGHVASLFPGRPALAEEGPVLAIRDAPGPFPRRLSLSLPVLAAAARVAIVAFGTEKAAAVAEALSDAGSTLPVAKVTRGARRCVFLLDRAAGRDLGVEDSRRRMR